MPIYGADIRLWFPHDHFVSGEPALDYRPSRLLSTNMTYWQILGLQGIRTLAVFQQ